MIRRADWVAAAPPRMDASSLADLLARHWGLAGELRPLYAERDLNLRLTTPAGERFLLKIAHADSLPGVLALQDRTLAVLARRAPELPVPRPVPDRSGHTLVALEAGGTARLLTWLEGESLDLAAAPARAVDAAGETLARLGLALRDASPDGAPGDLPWDLLGFQGLAPLRDAVAGDLPLSLLDRTLALHRDRLMPVLANLPRQLIHNDLNPDNLLFDPGEPGRVTGVIDFGDLVAAPVVCDLAVAGAYTLDPENADGIARLLTLVGAFHRVRPLDPREQSLVAGLVAARLSSTVLIQGARVAAARDPDGHLARVVDGATRRLEALYELGLETVNARVRETCADA